MAERGLAPLASLGQEALAARVAHEARRDHTLRYFDPVAGLPGFAAALARTLSELRLAGIDPEEVGSRGAAGADLGFLLTRYQQELSVASLADLAMIFEMAGDPAERMGLPLLLLDAPLDTRAHRRFFARLVAGAPAVLEALSAAAEMAGRRPALLGEDLDVEAPSTPIEHLRRFVFSQAPPASATREGFEMFSAPGEGLEAAEMARRILSLADSKNAGRRPARPTGTSFDQMAILLRSPERYQPVIEDALRRAGIPAYFSRGTVRPDPAGRAFLALLQCAAEDCSASSFAEYLSLGQVPAQERPEEWVAAADDVLTGSSAEPEAAAEPSPERPVNAPGGWERLLVDAAVIGGRERWARRLSGLEREFELRLEALADEDEAQRAHVSRQLARLHNLADFALPLIETLGKLPEEALWRDWLEALGGLARKALRSAEGVLAVLAEFEPMGSVGPVTVEEVAHVLSERLRFLRPEPQGRRWGRVFVGSIEEARGCEFRVVFLPGLAEGLFPRRALEDPLLLDDVRKELSLELPLRADRNHEERLKLRLAVAAASERLIASYPRMDAAEARARVPSFYALELPRALQGALPKLKEFGDETRAAASARLNWPAPREAAEAIDDAEYDLIALLPEETAGRRPARHLAIQPARYLMETNRHLARSLRARYSRWRPSWGPADGLVTNNAEALETLASQRLAARVWSPSALEQFATCPYKFALNGIHKLRPREDAAPLEELDPLTRGALFHEVQFAVLSELKAEGLLPLDGDRLKGAIDRADRTLDRVAAKYADDLAPAVPRVWRTGIEDLRTDLRGWLQHVAQNDGDWLPMHFEFAFGMEARAGHDLESTREEAVLDHGIRLRGSIDLVEKHVRSGALRVTDHKTGKAPERIPAYTGGGRVLQPVLYALAAERLFGAGVESGRLFYATQRGGYQQIGITVNASARRFMEKLLSNIDDAIASGFLPPVPEKDACGFCDYRAVCGPYEEQRASRTKNRQDERLDGLTEIRGFL
jgi:CRISPR/Cas system-associated exonuclease Cas4 (RecB family)